VLPFFRFICQFSPLGISLGVSATVQSEANGQRTAMLLPNKFKYC
jgi:hypothetical protein